MVYAELTVITAWAEIEYPLLNITYVLILIILIIISKISIIDRAENIKIQVNMIFDKIISIFVSN